MFWLVMNLLFSPWIAAVVLFFSFYIYCTWHHKHWANMDVPYLKPNLFFGNMTDRIFLRKSMDQIREDLYKRFEGHPIGGIFEGRRPMLLIRDPNLIRIILVKDFECFIDRIMFSINPHDVDESMLLFLKGSQWKDVRSVSTPIFSSGKIKFMSNSIITCIEHMIRYLDTHHVGKNDIELKKFFQRFTLDVIASCAFGFQTNSLSNPEEQFVKIISKFNNRSIFNLIGFFIGVEMLGSKIVAKLFGAHFINLEVQKYLTHFIMESKAQRKRETEEARKQGHVTPSHRTDFLQLMLDAQAGRLKKENTEHKDSDLYAQDAELKRCNTVKPSDSVVSDQIIIGQSLLFLLAGFETSSTLLTFACYELALNPDIQERARSEVHQAFSHYGDRCCYEALADMPYLENVLNETLRSHPPISQIGRECTVDCYNLEGTKAYLRKGDIAIIPIQGLLHDPQYFPEPEKFDPDRFLPENKQKRSPYVFLPFGSGPRNCIGMRFAMMSSKLALASLLNVYKFDICQRTEIPIKINKIQSISLQPANGVYLKINKIK